MNFDYCSKCENKEICNSNHWCVTMDKDGLMCDNYEDKLKVETAIEYSKELIQELNNKGEKICYKNISIEKILQTLVQAQENSVIKDEIRERIEGKKIYLPMANTQFYQYTEKEVINREINELEKLLKIRGDEDEY